MKTPAFAATTPTQRSTTSAPPVVIVGAGPAGLYAARQLGRNGVAAVIVDPIETVGAAAPLDPEVVAELSANFGAVWLLGRRATAVWGSLESGFNVELNTGESATGAAVIATLSPGAEPLTGATLPPGARTTESDLPGVFIIGDGAASADGAFAEAAAAARAALARIEGAPVAVPPATKKTEARPASRAAA